MKVVKVECECCVPDSQSVDPHVYMDQDLYLKNDNFTDINNANDMTNQSVKSLPDLYTERDKVGEPSERPSSTDLILGTDSRPEYLTIPIVKGAMGFGFTIADSAYGQKVKKILDRQRCKNLMEVCMFDKNKKNARFLCIYLNKYLYYLFAFSCQILHFS